MKAELLAPAGSYEGLQAVIEAGADAVYIGGSLFGARAYAKNPQQDQLLEAIDYTHLKGKKIYLTVNTLLKNRELENQLYEFLAPCYQRGVDAVIVQDLGVLDFVKKEFPGMAIHASTQMAITGPQGARLIQEAGASRVVTARELSLKEIRKIYDATGMEIESFVHGALCYCYSGMCLFSSMLGGRSGNRGRCAQPCRLPYTAYENKKPLNGKDRAYLLSPKDMCTIDLLPQILDAGVFSLKIEGRMKRAEYAAGVTSVYRKYLDLYEKNPAGYNVKEEDRQELLDLYQRDGFSRGYYQVHNGPQMIAAVNQKEQNRKENVRTARNEALFARLKKEYLDTKKKEKIHGNFILFADSPAILDLDFGNTHVQVTGPAAERAKKQPLSAERIRQQLEKTGQTPFAFADLEVVTDEAGFLPMQDLNQMRREGLLQLQQEYLRQFRRSLPQRPQTKGNPNVSRKGEERQASKPLSVSVETWEQFREALKFPEIAGIYCSVSMFSAKKFSEEADRAQKEAQDQGKEFYIALPYIAREDALDFLKDYFQEAKDRIRGFLVRNLEELGWLKKLGLLEQAVCDYSVYSFNDRAQAFLETLGVKRTTVPLELKEGEIRGKACENSELIVYGYYPMMISAQCIKKTCGTCSHTPGFVELKDRYGQNFRVQTCCDFCYNVIYNSVPTGLLQEASAIHALDIKALRMNFTWESAERTRELLELFTAAYKAGGEKIEKKIPAHSDGMFTKGHWKRGVE